MKQFLDTNDVYRLAFPRIPEAKRADVSVFDYVGECHHVAGLAIACWMESQIEAIIARHADALANVDVAERIFEKLYQVDPHALYNIEIDDSDAESLAYSAANAIARLRWWQKCKHGQLECLDSLDSRSEAVGQLQAQRQANVATLFDLADVPRGKRAKQQQQPQKTRAEAVQVAMF